MHSAITSYKLRKWVQIKRESTTYISERDGRSHRIIVLSKKMAFDFGSNEKYVSIASAVIDGCEGEGGKSGQITTGV